VNKGLVIALGLSLAANVFFGGFLAGRLAGGGHHRGAPFFDHGAHGEFGDLTPAAREALRREFEERRESGAEARREVRKAHKELIAALKAETFDRAAADKIADRMEAADASFRSGMARLVIEAAEGLSREDREALARHLDMRARRDRRPKAERVAPPPGPSDNDPPPTD
jgi:uncharacterized membrane protein